MESRGRKRRDPSSSSVCLTCDASLRAMNRSDRARHADNCQKIKNGLIDRPVSLFVSSSSSKASSNQASKASKESSKPVEPSDFIPADSGQSAVADRSWAQQQVAFLHPSSNVHVQSHCEYRSNPESHSEKRSSKRAKVCHCLDCDIRSLRTDLHSIDNQIAALNRQRSRLWLEYQAKAKSLMIDTSSYRPYSNAAHDSGFEEFVLRTPLESLSPPADCSSSLDHSNLEPGQFWQLQASSLTTHLHDLPFMCVEHRPPPAAPSNPFLKTNVSRPAVPIQNQSNFSNSTLAVSSPVEPSSHVEMSKSSTPPPQIQSQSLSKSPPPLDRQPSLAASVQSAEPSPTNQSFETIDLVPISANVDLTPITGEVDLTSVPAPVKASLDLTISPPPVISDIDLTAVDDDPDFPSSATDPLANIPDPSSDVSYSPNYVAYSPKHVADSVNGDAFDLPSDTEPGAYSPDASANRSTYTDLSDDRSPISSPSEPLSPDIAFMSSRSSMPPLEPPSPESPKRIVTELDIIDITSTKKSGTKSSSVLVPLLSMSQPVPLTSVSQPISHPITSSLNQAKHPDTTVSRAPIPAHPPAKPTSSKFSFPSSKDDRDVAHHVRSKSNVSSSFALSQPSARSPSHYLDSPLPSPSASPLASPSARDRYVESSPLPSPSAAPFPLPSPRTSPMGAPLIPPSRMNIDINKPSTWNTLSFVNLVAAVGAGSFDFSVATEPTLSRWMNELGLKSKSVKQMQERLTDIMQTLKTSVQPPAQSPGASPVNSPAQTVPTISQELVCNVRTFIRNNESLWLAVLLAQNIDFNCLYSCLQGAGIPVNKAELTAVLDAENIIFTQTNKAKPRSRQAVK